MKTIEYCLDETLRELEKQWQGERTDKYHIGAEMLLAKFELPNKHEFFKGIIDKLVKDGFAEHLSEIPKDRNIDHFQKEVVITVTGYYHISNNGYDQVRINRDAENTRVGKIESSQRTSRHWMTGLTIILAVGTTIAAVYYAIEILKYYHSNCCN